MTFVITIMIGAGALFLGSALDNTPLVQTFQKILANQPLDWTGQKSSIITQPGVGGGLQTQQFGARTPVPNPVTSPSSPPTVTL